MVFLAAFIASVVFTGFFLLRSRRTSNVTQTSPAFERFQQNYLIVYFLMVAGDWLQGPYVYALYASFGFSQKDIALLFVAGFGSSFLFGTFVGSLADSSGRKKWVVLYAVLYCLSCVTKHFNDFWMLMLGRVFGGIATSLLFSVFDSWMVAEHNNKGFPAEWLGLTFSLATVGNSLVAIVSGIIAQQIANMFPLTPLGGPTLLWGGFCSPFDLAFLVLVIGAVVTLRTWDENYGQSDHSLSTSALKSAFLLICRDRTVLFTGLIQSLFEGSMYTFVFMWTPALTDPSGKVETPHGLIFATFMVACMGGASMFNILSSSRPAASLLWQPLAISALALTIPVITTSIPLVLFSFVLFEVCIGMYFPIIGTIKGEVVPEESRSAVYNLFRVPLNIIVLGVLLSNVSVQGALCCASLMLCVATAMAFSLRGHVTRVAAMRSGTAADDVELLGESGL